MSEKTLVHMTEEGPASLRFAGVTWTPGRQAELDAEDAKRALTAFDYYKEGPAPTEEPAAEPPAEESESEAITTEDVVVDDAPVDPSTLTIDELKDELAAVEDVSTLEAIGEAEAAGENRTGALDAIDARLAALQEE